MNCLLRRILLASICLIFLQITSVFAQNAQERTNREIFDKVHATVSDGPSLPMSELVLRVAKALEGTPYVASTLEVEPESLQVFLDKTDCILFVETCTALALSFKGMEIVQGESPRQSEPSYELFCRNIQNLRYRIGEINGYPSRLHYTSEWILQGEANGIFREISGEKGEKKSQHFSFMSTHPGFYKQLRSNAEFRTRIAETENYLDSKAPYYYVSSQKLSSENVVREGDILAFVSTVDGLDVTHVAIACKVNGEMHFIHASTKSMKVIIEPKSLAEYVRSGVRIVRFGEY